MPCSLPTARPIANDVYTFLWVDARFIRRTYVVTVVGLLYAVCTATVTRITFVLRHAHGTVASRFTRTVAVADSRFDVMPLQLPVTLRLCLTHYLAMRCVVYFTAYVRTGYAFTILCGCY